MDHVESNLFSLVTFEMNSLLDIYWKAIDC